MLRLSNLADYAVVVMTTLARGGPAAGAPPAVPLSAAQVSMLSGVPAPTVAKLLGQLGRAGLLRSVRGVSGGFVLARAPAEVTLADIVEAIDGPIAITHCAQAETECDLAGCCPVRPHWEPVNRAVRGALAAVSLAEILPAPGTARAPASEEMTA